MKIILIALIAVFTSGLAMADDLVKSCKMSTINSNIDVKKNDTNFYAEINFGGAMTTNKMDYEPFEATKDDIMSSDLLYFAIASGANMDQIEKAMVYITGMNDQGYATSGIVEFFSTSASLAKTGYISDSPEMIYLCD